jgi:hypothetical protein
MQNLMGCRISRVKKVGHKKRTTKKRTADLALPKADNSSDEPAASSPPPSPPLPHK